MNSRYSNFRVPLMPEDADRPGSLRGPPPTPAQTAGGATGPASTARVPFAGHGTRASPRTESTRIGNGPQILRWDTLSNFRTDSRTFGRVWKR